MSVPTIQPIDPARAVIERTADHIEITWGAELLEQDEHSLVFRRDGKLWRVTAEEVDPQS